MNNHTVVNAENVSKTYVDGQRRTTVLHDVSLTVDPGECVAIIGTSGSGKSTLLHLLGGLDKPDEGSKVLINNQSIHELNVADQSALRNQSIGMVYQFHHLLPEFSAIENVALPAIMAGETATVAQTKARDILALVQLDHRGEHKPSALSGGERQRVAIARALINKPSIVLADEPTGNLDSKTAKITFDLMLELNRTSESALLIVTHDSSMASLADRVLELQDGKLL